MLSTNSNNWFPTNKLKPIQSTLYWCLYELRTKFSSKHGYVIYSITLQTKTLKHVRIRYSILIDACRRKCRKAIGKYKTLPAKHRTPRLQTVARKIKCSVPASRQCPLRLSTVAVSHFPQSFTANKCRKSSLRFYRWTATNLPFAPFSRRIFSANLSIPSAAALTYTVRTTLRQLNFPGPEIFSHNDVDGSNFILPYIPLATIRSRIFRCCRFYFTACNIL